MRFPAAVLALSLTLVGGCATLPGDRTPLEGVPLDPDALLADADAALERNELPEAARAYRRAAEASDDELLAEQVRRRPAAAKRCQEQPEHHRGHGDEENGPDNEVGEKHKGQHHTLIRHAEAPGSWGKRAAAAIGQPRPRQAWRDDKLSTARVKAESAGSWARPAGQPRPCTPGACALTATALGRSLTSDAPRITAWPAWASRSRPLSFPRTRAPCRGRRRGPVPKPGGSLPRTTDSPPAG